MARKNRVSVPDGTYHVTSWIVNREYWLDDPKLKDEIVSWIYGAAAFSGVELLAWAVMDNHFHLVVHVPKVPERLCNSSDDPPESHAFGMRPPECRPPLWSPGPRGDCPRAARPATGFMLSDEEMLERLVHLYGTHRVDAIRKEWTHLRETGSGSAVDAVKERYCRRMYNLSQFVKTLKERIAQTINRRQKHVGHVFEGRFYSGLIEDDGEVRRLVALYVDYNPYKAKLVRENENYAWSSFGQARGRGLHAEACRTAYERIYGCPWEEACAKIEAAFRERVENTENFLEQLNEGQTKATLSQLVHLKVDVLSRGAFIGRNVGFGKIIAEGLPKDFPRPSFKCLFWLQSAVEWKKSVA